MKKIVQTILIIVFAISVFVLVGSRALASTLTPVEEYPSQPKSRFVLSCENLKADLMDVRQIFLDKHEQMTQYLALVTHTTADWSAILRPTEGYMVQFPLEYFSPTRLSSVRFGETSDALYKEGDFVDNVVKLLNETIEKCAPVEQKEELTAKLEQFSEWENAHFSTTASFFTTMQGRLSDWSEVWVGIEGKDFDVPVEFFKSVEDTAGHFSEATDLVRQNGDLALRPFNEFSALIAP